MLSTSFRPNGWRPHLTRRRLRVCTDMDLMGKNASSFGTHSRMISTASNQTLARSKRLCLRQTAALCVHAATGSFDDGSLCITVNMLIIASDKGIRTCSRWPMRDCTVSYLLNRLAQHYALPGPLCCYDTASCLR